MGPSFLPIIWPWNSALLRRFAAPPYRMRGATQIGRAYARFSSREKKVAWGGGGLAAASPGNRGTHIVN